MIISALKDEGKVMKSPIAKHRLNPKHCARFNCKSDQSDDGTDKLHGNPSTAALRTPSQLTAATTLRNPRASTDFKHPQFQHPGTNIRSNFREWRQGRSIGLIRARRGLAKREHIEEGKEKEEKEKRRKNKVSMCVCACSPRPRRGAC